MLSQLSYAPTFPCCIIPSTGNRDIITGECRFVKSFLRFYRYFFFFLSFISLIKITRCTTTAASIKNMPQTLNINGTSINNSKIFKSDQKNQQSEAINHNTLTFFIKPPPWGYYSIKPKLCQRNICLSLHLRCRRRRLIEQWQIALFVQCPISLVPTVPPALLKSLELTGHLPYSRIRFICHRQRECASHLNRSPSVSGSIVSLQRKNAPAWVRLRIYNNR